MRLKEGAYLLDFSERLGRRLCLLCLRFLRRARLGTLLGRGDLRIRRLHSNGPLDQQLAGSSLQAES